MVLFENFFYVLFYYKLFLLALFRHFDKEKTGRLNHQEFKSCLRALGYDLPMVEEGQVDPEFETIVGMLFIFINPLLFVHY